MGVPGWPELAACTASIDKVRMVLMLSWSRLGSLTPSPVAGPVGLPALSCRVLDAPARELTAGFYDKTELQKGDKNFGAQGACGESFPKQFWLWVILASFNGWWRNWSLPARRIPEW